MRITAAGPGDAAVLASLHASAFAAPWSVGSLAEGIGARHGFAFLAVRGDTPLGFILAQAVAGEAEVLTLAVAPQARREGVGRALVEAAAQAAAGRGAATVWLEVAEDNTTAVALYAAAGFEAAGRRRGYYGRPGGAVDALMMRRRLNSAPA